MDTISHQSGAELLRRHVGKIIEPVIAWYAQRLGKPVAKLTVIDYHDLLYLGFTVYIGGEPFVAIAPAETLLRLEQSFDLNDPADLRRYRERLKVRAESDTNPAATWCARRLAELSEAENDAEAAKHWRQRAAILGDPASMVWTAQGAHPEAKSPVTQAGRNTQTDQL